jgi:hypothetical protein
MKEKEMSDTATGEGATRGLRRMLAVGAAAALLSVLGGLADIGISAALGGDISTLAHEAAGRFAELAARPLLGLYNLDLLNLLTTLIMVPALYACFLALRRESSAAGLALTLGVLAAAVFVANNPALPMLGLSMEYAGADAGRRSLLAAAGEAILAKGSHGSPGALAGFLLSTIANLVLSAAMAKTRVFPRAAAILGISGNLLLGVYLVLVTFLPRFRAVALALAAPGGLLALAWIVMIAAGLFRLSRRTTRA